MEAIATRIPNAIVAGDINTLRRLMLLNNIRLSAEVRYFDIQNVSGKWYAWYFEEASNILNEVNNKKLRGK